MRALANMDHQSSRRTDMTSRYIHEKQWRRQAAYNEQ